MDNRKIGIFDSGLGGLTVLKAVNEMIPAEGVVYFGDNGRAPYGTKSKEVIIKYTFQDINFLLSHDVKMIVIGCNTASACSLDIVKDKLKIPVVEVVEAGAEAALKRTKNKKIGIIGTSATVGSGVYTRAIKQKDSEVEVYAKACSMFVPLVEEGWWNNDIAERICREYLEPLKEENIDTLILGCTHYPLLQDTIQKVMGAEVTLINSATEVAKVIERTLNELEIGCLRNENYENDEEAEYEFFTSDSVEKFKALGSIFLGREVKKVKKADIDGYDGNY